MKKLVSIVFLLTVALGFSQNKILNGTFATDLTSWAGAPGAFNSGELSIPTSNPAAPVYSTEMYQAGLALTSSATYTVTFRARATTARTISVSIQHRSTWQDSFRNDAIALTTTMTTYSYAFTVNPTGNANNAQLNFHTGGVGSPAASYGVFIDDVSIMLGNVTATPCANGIKDGTETGVDCGGSCSACVVPTLYINDNSLTGDIWCSAVGHNTGTATGTVSLPYKNLTDLFADRVVAAGTIINIDSGTYSGRIVFSDGEDGVSGNVITIKGAGTAKTILTSSLSAGSLISTGGADYMTFQDFSISNNTETNAIFVTGTSTNCTFTNLNISVIGHGIQVDGSGNNNTTITKNIINGNNGNANYGIFFSGTTASSGHSIINNMVFNFAHTFRNENTLVTNTNLYNNSFYAYQYGCVAYLAGWNVKNNIFYTTSNTGTHVSLWYGDAQSPNTLNNNLYYNPNAAQTITKYGTNQTYATLAVFKTANLTYEVNGVEGNPLFTSTTDLHILTGSPAIGAGSNVGVTDDIDGTTRPLGGTYEIGADEAVAAVTAPALTTTAATAIASTTATMNGNISSNGGAAITSYGFYWSTTNGFINGAGTPVVVGTTNTTGNITSNLTGLTTSTIYYYKAYATNSSGTTYGTQQSFTAITAPTLGPFTVPAKSTSDVPFPLTSPTSNSGGAFTYASSNTAVATISGTTVTIVGAGTSVITATQAANGAYGSGSTTASFVVSFSAAPLPPCRASSDVVALYNEGPYTISTTENNWGASGPITEISFVGNKIKLITDTNYAQIAFNPTTPAAAAAAAMTFLHVDIYSTTASASQVKVFVNTSTTGYYSTPNGVWTSLDIPASSFGGFASVSPVKILLDTPGTFYVDNIYFYRVPATPTFTQVPAVCSGATMTALPTTSNNGINGTWSPALNNTATTLYTFTTSGTCPNTTTMTITVNPSPTTTPVYHN